MQSIHQLANELNRVRLACAGRQRPARWHLALLGAPRRAVPGERRMRRQTRDLPVVSRLPRFGVAVMLTAPLLAVTGHAMAAASGAGNAPIASAWNATAPDTAVAVSLAGFPEKAAKTDGAVSDKRTAHAAMPYPRAFIEWKLSARPTGQCGQSDRGALAPH
jgi:hypothetical protein